MVKQGDKRVGVSKEVRKGERRRVKVKEGEKKKGERSQL